MRKAHSAAAVEEVYHSTGLWEAFSRQIGSFIGIFMVGAVIIAAAALVSWNFADPSLNNYAAVEKPTNLLGFWGASFADISMQFFGLGSAALLLPPFFWGIMLIVQKNLPRLSRRMGFWLLSLFLLCLACAFIAPPPGWPMPIGAGGVTGDKLLALLSLLPVALPHAAAFAAAPVFMLLSLFCAAYAGGVIGRAPKARNAAIAPPQAAPKAQEAETAMPPAAEAVGSAAQSAGRIERLRTFWGMILHLCLWIAALLRHVFAPLARVFSGGAKRQAERHEPQLSPARAAPAGREEASPARQARFFTALNAGAAEKPRNSHKSGHFALPNINYLTMPKKIRHDMAKMQKLLHKNTQSLSNVLEDFGVKGDIVQAYPGPVVTLYELEPAPGVKSSRIISLSDDIARSMSAASARIAVIPGRNALGIELPNSQRETVFLRGMLESADYDASKARLALALGQTIGGEAVIADLAKMPHLLVAGTTGSGKSVAINTMILSLLYRMTPQECRLIMVDPKMLELSVYDGIPHLLTPVVTDPKKALSALKWAVREMEERYRKMARLGVRNIDGFNARVKEAQNGGGESLSRTVQTGFDKETGKPVYETEEIEPETMPYIVVIIDEMADLMMVAGKEIEGAVQRLAQMARAAGIHVIMATQRPSVDVITGTIKANFPTRISFQVTSKIDSRTILGEQGAEALLGQGDMLYMEGGGRIKRVHGPFVGDLEVERVVSHLKKQGAPEYLSAVMEDGDEESEDSAESSGKQDSGDPYDKAVDIVLRDRKASTSYIQRRLGIGYNRAATLIERMEDEGVISAANHAGKREILVPERESA